MAGGLREGEEEDGGESGGWRWRRVWGDGDEGVGVEEAEEITGALPVEGGGVELVVDDLEGSGPESFAGVWGSGDGGEELGVEERPGGWSGFEEIEGEADGEVKSDEVGDGITWDDKSDLGTAGGEDEGFAWSEGDLAEVDGEAEGE